MAIVNTSGFIEEDEKRFVTRRWLAENTHFSFRQICKDLRKKNISYILRLHQHPLSKKSQPVRFYNFAELTTHYSKYELEKRYIFSPPNSLLRRKPKNLSEKEYHIFLTLLIYRVETDHWPSITNIRAVLKNKYSPMDISRILSKLIEKFYLSVKISDINQREKATRAFVVHKGPKELLRKTTHCASCKTNIDFLRDFASPSCELF